MRYGPTRYGADGEVVYGPVSSGNCCPPIDLCVDFCALACSFVNLLPSGPMWDQHKAQAVAHLNGGGITGCDELCPPPFPCPSLILHSIYVARKLQYFIQEVLWPAVRESYPQLAYTTLDDWLDRLGWVDCYNQHCRNVMLNGLTPFEIMDDCGQPLLCKGQVVIPPELECAVKHGIVLALQRLNMGIIKNLASINWVIEPLCSVLTPPEPVEGVDPCCEQQKFTISPTNNSIPACPSNLSLCGGLSTPVACIQSYVENDRCHWPVGLPNRIYPATVAAECIVRSMLAQTCPDIIQRGCYDEVAVVTLGFELLSGDQQTIGAYTLQSGDVGNGRIVISEA